MPSPKRSPKSSPKKSPKSSPKGSDKNGPKLSKEEIEAFEKRMLARKRYETMDVVFKQSNRNIILYVRSIHLYEVWNKIPAYEQFCNSNTAIESTNVNASPKKSPKNSPGKSPKKSPKMNKSKSEPQDEPPKPDLEPAIMYGVCSVRKDSLTEAMKLFIEVTAHFRFYSHTKIPPFVEDIGSQCQCYRETIRLDATQKDHDEKTSDFSARLYTKVKNLGHNYRGFHFTFDLTRKPDSIFFNHPYYYQFTSGLFWTVRAFIAPDETCTPLPGNEVKMEFYKYTITPALSLSNLRETPPVEYVRYSTLDDTGDLVLQAGLDRDVYYHGQDITVKIQIDNGSNRHVVSSVVVFVEQTYRLFHQFPHDISIPLGEIIMTNESGIPVRPRGKWNKEIKIKPAFDQTKNNLAIDGKMPIDDKVFMASSTVIMNKTIVPIPPEELEQMQKMQATPKASPGKSPKGSPKGKSPKEKSPKKSPKEKSSPKGGKKSPGPVPAEKPPTEEVKPLPTTRELNLITNRQACRSIFISYDVVVRLNLETANGDESGHPMVRLPFILTRETRFLDKYTNPPPPVWSSIVHH